MEKYRIVKRRPGAYEVERLTRFLWWEWWGTCHMDGGRMAPIFVMSLFENETEAREYIKKQIHNEDVVFEGYADDA